MSVFDINKVFSYVFPTSSLDYIRNYNFNDTTATPLPLLLTNTSEDTTITVNMETTEPWVVIRDITSAVDLRYPSGNVVLPPTSSIQVLVIVDLPPDVENRPGTITLRPNITLDIKSGSFPIYPPRPTSSADTPPQSNIRITTSTDSFSMFSNQTADVGFTIFEGNTTLDIVEGVSISSTNPSVAIIAKSNTLVPTISPIRVQGVSGGETQIKIQYKDAEATVNVTVVAVTQPPPLDRDRTPPSDADPTLT